MLDFTTLVYNTLSFDKRTKLQDLKNFKKSFFFLSSQNEMY